MTVGPASLIGPFARLRPGATLGAEVHIGNFVEVKNSTLAAGAKANHLAYLGDATVGERVNYGAGSITANYDGANKHRTVIEADVHVGSNCVLVAPVTIGAGGTVGGGSTITKRHTAGRAVGGARQAGEPGQLAATSQEKAGLKAGCCGKRCGSAAAYVVARPSKPLWPDCSESGPLSRTRRLPGRPSISSSSASPLMPMTSDSRKLGGG